MPPFFPAVVLLQRSQTTLKSMTSYNSRSTDRQLVKCVEYLPILPSCGKEYSPTTPPTILVCFYQYEVCISNVKPTFFQDRLLSFSYKRSPKNRIFSFFKQNSLSNQNVLFQISKFLVQKQSIFSVSKFFWDFKKFCSGFRNLWIKSKRFGFVQNFLD